MVKKIYRSEDAGETWENMSMNLPNLPANCVEIERSSTGGVYVGTDVGVYYWDSSLTEWEPYMTNLPNVIVNELEIHESTSLIRAATYGRGLWETPTRNYINVGIEDNQASNPIQHLQVWPNPATELVNIEFNEDSEIHNLVLVDAYGRTVRANLNPEAKKKFTIGIQELNAGVYYLSKPTGKQLVGRFIVIAQ